MKHPLPVHLIAGGDFRNCAGMIARIASVLELTGNRRPAVACIGAASGDDDSFFTWAATLIRQAGASRVTLAACAGDDADITKAKSVLDEADAVFISGGDVEEGMRWIDRHALAPFLASLFNNGCAFFGLSAGSIMLGTKWVRWRAPQDDSVAELFDCLGIAPILCDTHAENDDWEELKAALALSPAGTRGYGIPSGGTLRITLQGGVAALDKPAVCFLKTPRGVMPAESLPAEKQSP